MSPDVLKPIRPIADSYLARFSAAIASTEDCWIWRGAVGRAGRARFWFKNKRWIAARWIYWVCKGDLIDGLVIMHSCDNPSCVNPEHLSQGTVSDNAKDMWDKGRRSADTVKAAGWQRNLTHCKRGHEFTPENTQINYGKWRECRACKRVNYKARKAREIDRQRSSDNG